MKNVDVLSCIQPTGEMHIGNYFGAVNNWVELQADHNCIYGIVDLHAMTNAHEPEKLRRHTDQMIIDLLACGIDPRKSTLFVQSLVPEHVELSWILGTMVSHKELAMQKQFVSKTENKNDDDISAGLFSYPILQAADILIYRPDAVPVGKDQDQHLELTQRVAKKFNKDFGTVFNVPVPKFTQTPEIKSLVDPSKKMSKSLSDEHSIKLFETEAAIRRKISGANFSAEGKDNLLEILKACGSEGNFDELSGNENLGELEIKTEVTEALLRITAQLKKNRTEVLKDTSLMNDAIREMSKQARQIARDTLFQVKEKIGIKNISNF